MSRYANHIQSKRTPQSEAIPGSNQIANSAGGYSFPVTDAVRLERFLLLGSEKGSFYVGEKKLTTENSAAVINCIKNDGLATVQKIVAVSEAGRAPKNSPAVFALALAATHGDEETKRAAFAAVNRVCRIGTHVFEFASACDALRGWGRGLKRAIANWYNSKEPDALAYQVAKYQQRDGWSHRDLLRLSHPTPVDDARRSILRWATHGADGLGDMTTKRGEVKKSYGGVGPLPRLLEGVERAKKATTVKEVVGLIADYGLPRECVPTQFLTDKAVWEALLPKMPITALIRNLGNLSKCELLTPLSDAARLVTQRLGDVKLLKRGRVHPLAVLLASTIYSSGCSVKGSGTWTPVPAVTAALDDAFYLAFASVEPTHKRWLLALDVSGSMGGSFIAGSLLSCRDATAALALVTARTESQYHVMGFSNMFVPLGIGKGDTMAAAIRKVSGLPFAGTDCSLPMTWALQTKTPVDVFVVYTDNETWAGSIHPSQALKEYRQRMGIPAKMVVCGMVANSFTIADPMDAGMMDVTGFDASVPEVMAQFVGRPETGGTSDTDDDTVED